MTDKERSSIHEFDRPADRIRQHRQVSALPALIVEGPEDELVLKQHLEAVEIFPVGGKNNVIETARILKGWGIGDFVSITDNDFDAPDEVADIADAHHPYEQRDLESMLIQLGVLSQMIEHLGSASKILEFGGSAKVVEFIEAKVDPISALRNENTKRNWGLAFDKVDLASKIDKNTLDLKVSNYCAALVQISISNLKSHELQSLAKTRYNDDLGHRGKDVIVFTGVALKKRFGNQPEAVCKEDVLVALLRSSGGLALSQSKWLASLVEKLKSPRTLGA